MKQFEKHGFTHKKEGKSFCCICLRWRIYGSTKEVEQHFRSHFHKTNKIGLLGQIGVEEETDTVEYQSNHEEEQRNQLEDQSNITTEVMLHCN